jgi:tether containing UBX domain for GLUT4
MSSLTVLCPNGRRQQVKVQANTKILDIIEEVSKKQGYVPEEYDLIHQKKRVDVTMTYRLSGIPNNAQLELKKNDVPRSYSEVILSLQMDDGTRLNTNSFKPNITSLYDVLVLYSTQNEQVKSSIDQVAQKASEKQLICSYLNERVVGEFQLKNTTLKDLGLTSGRGIIRFESKQMSEEQFKQLDDEFRIKLQKKQKLDEIYSKQKLLHQQEQMEEAAQIESIKGEQRLPSVSVEPMEKQENQYENSPKQSEKRIKLDLNEQSSLQVVSNSSNRAELYTERSRVEVNEFANFKFPEETKGKDLNQVNELAEIEKISKEPCDRQGVLFNFDDEAAKATREETNGELDDNFYDVTVQDLRLMLEDLKSKQNEETPLMTRQMRELEQDKKAMKYSKIAVRVQFKNRLGLQGLFRPKELISQLYKFVNESLSQENSSDDLDFYLFTSPPKTILHNKKATFFEQKLYPAALVYFKNKSDQVPKFRKELLDNFKTIKEADELVQVNVHDTMRDVKSEGIDWLHKEQSVAQNILRQGLASSQQNQNMPHQHEGGQNSVASSKSDIDDLVSKKLSKFLGSKK